MNNQELFLSLYNELDELLSCRFNNSDRNKSNINLYINELSSSSYFQNKERGKKLNDLRLLRNLLIHDLDMNTYDFVLINEDATSFLSNEINILKNPIKASDMMTKRGNLFYASLDNELTPLYKEMIQKGHTQVPILDLKNRLLGVLSPNSIFLYMSEHSGKEPHKVRELINYIAINKHISEYYSFVNKNVSKENVNDLFDKYYQKGKKLAMAFVTEDGKEEQSILGVITPYDVLKKE